LMIFLLTNLVRLVKAWPDFALLLLVAKGNSTLLSLLRSTAA
jgi:hypothetical protein